MTATLDRRADYVSAVAVELGDLAPDDRAELIEELDDHVAALLEDRPDVDLVAELGTPRAYAAELRNAAGLVGVPAGRPPLGQRLRALVRQADAALPDWTRPYLAASRPAWWVLRGYFVVAFLAVVLGSGSWRAVFVPTFAGNWVAGVVLTVVGVLASVRLGTWRPSRRGWVVAILALDVVALWCGGVVATQMRADPTVVYNTEYLPNCPIELDNLYAYDASGKPLDSVRLFDQNGTPFDLSRFGCNVGGQFSPGVGGTNAYPWPTASYGEDSVPTGPPSSLAPLPGATVSSAPAAPAAPSSAPSPTGTS